MRESFNPKNKLNETSFESIIIHKWEYKYIIISENTRIRAVQTKKGYIIL